VHVGLFRGRWCWGPTSQGFRTRKSITASDEILRKEPQVVESIVVNIRITNAKPFGSAAHQREQSREARKERRRGGVSPQVTTLSWRCHATLSRVDAGRGTRDALSARALRNRRATRTWCSTCARRADRGCSAARDRASSSRSRERPATCP